MKPHHVFIRAFWKTGVWCLGIVIVCSAAVGLLGPKSPASLLFLPFFMILFQVPYLIIGFLFGGIIIFNISPWIAIPLWSGIVFIWNGFIGGCFAMIWNYLRGMQKSEQTGPANHRPSGTSVMAPADPASRAGAMPEASGDS